MKTTRLILLSTLLLSPLAGCDGGTDDNGVNEGETDSGDGDGDGDTETETETGEPEPLDDDEDGLTNEEEAELGTDPKKKDTDGDNYWDPWELAEGTDPLDYDSRIYTGFWPYNPNKDELVQGTWATTGKQVGKPFPRQSFLDQHGDYVDVYDFANFTVNQAMTPAFFIFDISAQWCGPCHNVANWIKGVDDANTTWIQELYPTVREKVHSLRIWWVTFIVQDQAGGAPTLADAQSWFTVHKDNYIPILVDETQQVQDTFLGNAFPHFFLLDPTLAIEYFPPPGGGTNEDPYPAVGLVDTLL
ncbi:TlpA family protein disulfide reductase [Enhygromyxa salina]|uniref:Thioredoxin domain-containing protein n=1 Tax=Enhygromyxa salina TaxID=215803 RepID=A0A2S9YP15_9BACT|nr:thrombospondin type 3 repeat-containing protein [Enhygromyxa salina]PRQ06830.1 hypothetical protein ENSA7_34900 [Enhygromyxa salina]